LRKNAGTDVEAGGFSRPTGEKCFGLQPRFDRMVRRCASGIAISFSFNSLRSLKNSKDPKGQTAAEAGRMFAPTGRLKPPSSAVVQAFFRNDYTHLLKASAVSLSCLVCSHGERKINAMGFRQRTKNPRHFDSTLLTISPSDRNTGNSGCVPRDLRLESAGL